MTREEFFSNDDIQLIKFANQLKEKIEVFCKQNVFLTHNQLLVFIEKNVKQFVSRLHAKEAVRSVYTRELLQLINIHLAEIVKKYHLFWVY
ncbi:hypothetical protein [Radiobacillus sp. PE A8.2]|uniref:hypothetical protein n=1 Tax=Radiobacillus sp. PE A8.2 TaxID=3380349 RepID=UPI00388D7415